MINILDHGYINIIESWGSDERIIEAARMSTGKGFLGWETPCDKCKGTGASRASHLVDGDSPCTKCKGSGVYGDEKLLEYLYTHKHMTPFEMCGVTFEVQAPIFVFREWHRHRTQSYNEMSGRYIELPNLSYVPSIERLMNSKQSLTNKQASMEGFDYTSADILRLVIKNTNEESRLQYEKLLQDGVSKEIARLVLPVAQYSRMRASANLRNWLQFLVLRMAPNAQWEIRQYANVVHNLLIELFPKTMELFDGENKSS